MRKKPFLSLARGQALVQRPRVYLPKRAGKWGSLIDFAAVTQLACEIGHDRGDGWLAGCRQSETMA